ncbi:hypothetical protein G210_4346 [Candida maltosa Xu316]|uniref:Uncharacterized protein n=1 Tax=Candida maltosa (strain Xu316) TaxID=1245528 RepID=M3IGS1_CANMX|nr:hypothetical protein G210_4346 [Candida maltosa Xu316]
MSEYKTPPSSTSKSPPSMQDLDPHLYQLFHKFKTLIIHNSKEIEVQVPKSRLREVLLKVLCHCHFPLSSHSVHTGRENYPCHKRVSIVKGSVEKCTAGIKVYPSSSDTNLSVILIDWDHNHEIDSDDIIKQRVFIKNCILANCSKEECYKELVEIFGEPENYSWFENNFKMLHQACLRFLKLQVEWDRDPYESGMRILKYSMLNEKDREVHAQLPPQFDDGFYKQYWDNDRRWNLMFGPHKLTGLKKFHILYHGILSKNTLRGDTSVVKYNLPEIYLYVIISSTNVGAVFLTNDNTIAAGMTCLKMLNEATGNSIESVTITGNIQLIKAIETLKPKYDVKLSLVSVINHIKYLVRAENNTKQQNEYLYHSLENYVKALKSKSSSANDLLDIISKQYPNLSSQFRFLKSISPHVETTLTWNLISMNFIKSTAFRDGQTLDAAIFWLLMLFEKADDSSYQSSISVSKTVKGLSDFDFFALAVGLYLGREKGEINDSVIEKSKSIEKDEQPKPVREMLALNINGKSNGTNKKTNDDSSAKKESSFGNLVMNGIKNYFTNESKNGATEESDKLDNQLTREELLQKYKVNKPSSNIEVTEFSLDDENDESDKEVINGKSEPENENENENENYSDDDSSREGKDYDPDLESDEPDDDKFAIQYSVDPEEVINLQPSPTSRLFVRSDSSDAESEIDVKREFGSDSGDEVTVLKEVTLPRRSRLRSSTQFSLSGLESDFESDTGSDLNVTKKVHRRSRSVIESESDNQDDMVTNDDNTFDDTNVDPEPEPDSEPDADVDMEPDQDESEYEQQTGDITVREFFYDLHQLRKKMKKMIKWKSKNLDPNAIVPKKIVKSVRNFNKTFQPDLDQFLRDSQKKQSLKK